MRVIGKLVLIEKPEVEQAPSGIELLPEAIKAKEEEMIKKFTALNVFAIGDEVIRVKAGDKVLITPKTLSFLDQVELEGKLYFVAQEHQIIAVH